MQQRVKLDANFFKYGRRVITSIHDRNDSVNNQSKVSDMLNRAQAASAGRDDVLHHDSALARFDRPFDLLTRSVLFSFFANDETFERIFLLPTTSDDCRGNWIGSNRHPTNGIGQIVGQRFEDALGDYIGGFTVERQLTTVEVVRRFFSRRQCEVSKLKGILVHQFNQSLSIVQNRLFALGLLGWKERPAELANFNGAIEFSNRQYDGKPRSASMTPPPIATCLRQKPFQ